MWWGGLGEERRRSPPVRIVPYATRYDDPVAAARAGGRLLRAGRRLALLHVPANDVSSGALFRHEPNLLVGYTGLVSFARRLLRDRSLRHRAPHEEGGRLVPHRVPRRGGHRRALRAGLRVLLRAPHPHLLRDAHARLRPDRVGHLLQVERGDGRRAGHARDPLSRFRLARAGRERAAGGGRVPHVGVLLLPHARAGRGLLLGPAPRRRLPVRPDAHHHPRESERADSSASTSALRDRGVRAGGRFRRAGGRPLRHLQSASSPTSPTGPSPPRC